MAVEEATVVTPEVIAPPHMPTNDESELLQQSNDPPPDLWQFSSFLRSASSFFALLQDDGQTGRARHMSETYARPFTEIISKNMVERHK